MGIALASTFTNNNSRLCVVVVFLNGSIKLIVVNNRFFKPLTIVGAGIARYFTSILFAYSGTVFFKILFCF